MSVQPLGATIEEDLVMVGWSDAAVGNRPDMTSTGGHVTSFSSARCSWTCQLGVVEKW